MLQILRETTEWSTGNPVPNHIYLLDEANRLIAHAKFGGDEIVLSKAQFKIDKRHRTFVREKHSGLAAIAKTFKTEKNPNTRVFKVKSKNKEYTVSLEGSNYSCTCTGFNFRGNCKHITAVANMIQSKESA